MSTPKLSALLVTVLLAACPQTPTKAPEPAKPAAPEAAATQAAGPANGTVQGTEPATDIKPVYSGNPTANPLATRLCTLFASYPLERQAACCSAPKASLSFESECARVVTVALNEKHVKLDEAKVAACETAYKKQLEDCDRVMSNVSPPPEACQGLFEGSLAAGAVCRSELECQKGLSCVGLGPTDPGHCSLPSPAGAPCHPVVDPLAVYTKQNLDDHPSCTNYCNRHTCGDFLKLGDACIFDTQCGPKNRCAAKKCVAGAHVATGGACMGNDDCVLDSDCFNGKCQPRGKTGAACTSDDQCLGECDKATSHCAPRCQHAFVPVWSKPQKPAK